MDSTSFLSFLPSWIILVVIALFTIYFVARLLPKSKIDLKGKYVLITGCDRGFGRATARALDKMGDCVLATCLTKEGEQSLKSVTSEKLKTFQMDVTNSKQIRDVYSEVRREISSAGLWGLVNNAGIICCSPIEWTPLDDFKRSADVNLWGMIDVTKTFLPLLKKTPGRVVNLSSMLGRLTVPFYGAYCVTKYGVEAFSDALRREMQPWGIKVSMLEPGAFLTDLISPASLEQQLRQRWNALSDELKNDYGEEYLTRAVELRNEAFRNLDINEVVNTIVEALMSSSPRDRYLVGQDAKNFLVWLTRLPTSVADYVICASVKQLQPRGASVS
ncbi:short-chain dehydrogenase/reductase family 9C member 7-like [Orbicella faveolata]|uniref:short-chain dehydrogenase/reductase family 9C member 7-like n=1 Tax=Orbicella faveolata TaxID=48498 RepID=UPI0009E4A0C2|nr:short-chain dehydrogenase/reductase family 9C member 7-like [Orbicella faveolata]